MSVAYLRPSSCPTPKSRKPESRSTDLPRSLSPWPLALAGESVDAGRMILTSPCRTRLLRRRGFATCVGRSSSSTGSIVGSTELSTLKTRGARTVAASAAGGPSRGESSSACNVRCRLTTTSTLEAISPMNARSSNTALASRLSLASERGLARDVFTRSCCKESPAQQRM